MTREEQYLAKIAGEETDIPNKPILRSEQYLAKIAGEDVEIPEKPLLNEEIYLAILTGESYDIPAPYNRIEQYMAKACGLEIEVPTPITRVEQLWAQIAEGWSWTVTKITGTLPLTFLSKGDDLKDYRIHGTTEGAGVETENLCDCTTFAAGHIDGNGNVADVSSTTYVNGLPDGSIEFTTSAWRGVHTEKFLIPAGATEIRFYYQGSYKNNQFRFAFYDSNGDIVSQSARSGGNSFTTTIPVGAVSVAIGIQLSAPTTYKFTELQLYTDLDTITSFVPHGYKIPILNTSGVTENLWDGSAVEQNKTLQPNGDITASQYSMISDYMEVDPLYQFTLAYDYTSLANTSNRNVIWYDSNKSYLGYNSYITVNKSTNFRPENGAKYVRISVDLNVTDVMFTQGSTPPDHYIPHRYESNYDLFIGSTKLGEEEYVDYGEQKVYKDVSGTLTPTDPPAPFPAILTYQGENTLSSTETLGDVTIKGKIKEAVPNG